MAIGNNADALNFKVYSNTAPTPSKMWLCINEKMMTIYKLKAKNAWKMVIFILAASWLLDRL